MNKETILNLINEEISQFDFLNNNKYLKEEENNQILTDNKFQKQFIIDSITKKREKVQTKEMDLHIGDIDYNEEYDTINLSYIVEINYKFEDQDIKFTLDFDGDDIDVNLESYKNSGSYEEQPEEYSWIDSIAWDMIQVEMYDIDGNQIQFKAYNDSSDKLRELFIRSYVQDIIEERLNIEIKEKMPRM